MINDHYAEISKKSASIQSRSLIPTPTDKNVGSGSSSGPAASQEIVVKDSVLNGVFVALDYDKDMLSKIR